MLAIDHEFGNGSCVATVDQLFVGLSNLAETGQNIQ
jgi:hypothetical protein